MHVLAESSLFTSAPIPYTKENDGKVQRRNMIVKIRAAVIAAVLITIGYHIVATNAQESARVYDETRKANLRDPSNNNAVKVKTGTSPLQRMILFTVNNLDGVSGNKGEFILQMEPTWAPIGVERVIELTTLQFWNGCRFFRVLPDFMAQFGIAADPSLNTFSNLIDDPVKQTNARGTVSFATSGPDTRSTQLFINTNKDGNAYLDRQGFAPIGKVIKGMDVVDRLYNEYGEGAPNGQGPRQGLLYQRGNEYLEKDFPRLSYIVSTQFLN